MFSAAGAAALLAFILTVPQNFPTLLFQDCSCLPMTFTCPVYLNTNKAQLPMKGLNMHLPEDSTPFIRSAVFLLSLPNCSCSNPPHSLPHPTDEDNGGRKGAKHQAAATH